MSVLFAKSTTQIWPSAKACWTKLAAQSESVALGLNAAHMSMLPWPHGTDSDIGDVTCAAVVLRPISASSPD